MGDWQALFDIQLVDPSKAFCFNTVAVLVKRIGCRFPEAIDIKNTPNKWVR